jgi:4-carboxymuconolactone decarboxylase
MLTREELLTRVSALTPEAADGYRQIRAVLESDGALSAPVKALLIAVAASARGGVDLARAELERGRSIGLSSELIELGGAAILLSRGELVCARYLEAAGEAGEPPAKTRLRCDDDGVGYFLAYNRADTIPSRMARLHENAPEVFDGYFRMHHGSLSSGPETDAIAELMMCSVNAAELQPGFVAIHAEGARRRGVSEAQLIEAVLCAIPASGVGAWASAAAALFPDQP